MAPPSTRKVNHHWQWVKYAFGLLIVVLLLLERVGWMPLPFLERLEWQAYDMRVRSTLSGVDDPALAIIDIDERSLLEIGQ